MCVCLSAQNITDTCVCLSANITDTCVCLSAQNSNNCAVPSPSCITVQIWIPYMMIFIVSYKKSRFNSVTNSANALNMEVECLYYYGLHPMSFSQVEVTLSNEIMEL